MTAVPTGPWMSFPKTSASSPRFAPAPTRLPGQVVLTLGLAALLLVAAYMIGPPGMRWPILIVLAALVIVVAFVSVEVSLALLILSTLLSPEIQVAGGQAASTTTASRGVTIRVDDVLLALVTLSWMFRVAVRKELGLLRATPLNRPFLWYWAVCLFTTVLGAAAGRVGLMGYLFVLKYLEYFLLFFMIANYVHDAATARRFLVVMLFTCMAASLIGIAQIPQGVRVSAPFEGKEGEPNTFGGYLVLMFAVTLGVFFEGNWPRLPLLMLMGVILPPLAFTESRSSYLAFIVMMLAMFVYSQHKRVVALALLAGVAIAPVALPKNVIQRIEYTFAQPPEEGQLEIGGIRVDTSTSERLKSWKAVLTKAYPQHPIFGVGVTGGFFLDAQYPRVLLESGMVGLVLFVWVLRRIWTMLRTCYEELRDPVLRGAALGTLAGFAGLLFHALGANTFIIVRIMEPLMILLGLLVGVWLAQRKEVQA